MGPKAAAVVMVAGRDLGDDGGCERDGDGRRK